VIRNAAKTLIIKVLFTEWLKTMFLSQIESPRAKANSTVLVMLLFDGQSTPVPDVVIAFAQSERILIIGLVSHSSHLSQPRDLCTFGLLKRFEKNGQKNRNLKENLQRFIAYCTHSAKSQLFSWFDAVSLAPDFVAIRLISCAPLTINYAEFLTEINIPEMFLEQLVFQEPAEAPASAGRLVRRRAGIPSLIEFTVSLTPCIDKMSGLCP
jgi:hypothetical protein